jgi:hypothetical protein
MTYELAKQLKDAGFPQQEWRIENEIEKVPEYNCGYHLFYENADESEGPHIGGNDRIMRLQYFNPTYLAEHPDWIVYVPTLEELISACGKRLSRIIQTEVQWIAYADYPPRLHVVNAPTIEEAVALLWLALNKNV